MRKKRSRQAKKVTSTTIEPRSKRGRPRGTGTDTIYQSVRAQILDLSLEPGSDLDETELVKEFKLSRTPVREALIRLSSEGLIKLLPNIGARVASLTANEVPQILESLELVQRATTRWAAIRRNASDLTAIKSGCEAFASAMRDQNYNQMTEANHAFHFAIANASRNVMLADFHESLQCSTLRLGRLAFSAAPTNDSEYRLYYATVDQQHRTIVEAIEKNDAILADDTIRKHIALFRDRLVRHLSSSLATEIAVA